MQHRGAWVALISFLMIVAVEPDSFATTGPTLTVQGESFTQHTIGSAVSDPSASDGTAWELPAAGYIGTNITLAQAGTYVFAASMRGTVGNGSLPVANLLVDGHAIGHWYVGTSYAPYTAADNVDRGQHLLQISFGNDATGRSLFVDSVTITLTNASALPSLWGNVASFSYRTTGHWFYDISAGDFVGYVLPSNGTVAWGFHAVSSEEITVDLFGYGTYANGIGANMTVSIDGTPNAQIQTTDTGLWNQYSFNATVPAGDHNLSILFDNHLTTATEVRDLVLNQVRIRVTSPAPTFGTCPTNVPDPVTTWRSYGRDLANKRFNTNELKWCTNTAHGLTLAWRFSAGSAVTSTPAVANHRVYFGTWAGSIIALNATTGKVVWNVPVGAPVDSSPAVTTSTVYVGTGAGRLLALDAKNGRTRWAATQDQFPATHFWGSPVLAKGLVIIGVASDQELPTYTGTINFRGSVVAYNASTGAKVWQTYTAAPGTTGAPVWATPAVDLASNTLFFGTGNAYNASAGPNTDAIMAANLTTGAILWSRQTTPGDVFTDTNPAGPDFDFGASPNLFVAHGQLIVGEGSKSGVYYALYASNGTQMWNYTAQPSASPFLLGTAATGNGMIYQTFAGENRVVAFSQETGASAWQRIVPQPIFSPATLSLGFVFYAYNGNVSMVNAFTGEEVGTIQPGGFIDGGVSIGYGRAYVGSIGGGFTSTTGQVDCFLPT
ncbi:MAG: outer membrane protein assembly factor BamB family protein [Thermoplasmatota archaeon]